MKNAKILTKDKHFKKIRRGLYKVNVIKLKRENNALDIALMVESATRTERQ